MHINAHDFLNDEQKAKIGEAFCNKAMEGIESLEFVKGKKINITAIIENELQELFQHGDAYEEIDFKKIGATLTKKIIGSIQP